jgi:hypothetical protein
VKVELEPQKKFHTIPINTEFYIQGFQSENHEETRKTRNEGAKKTQNGASSSK